MCAGKPLNEMPCRGLCRTTCTPEKMQVEIRVSQKTLDLVLNAIKHQSNRLSCLMQCISPIYNGLAITDPVSPA